ncbi:MAG TPA: nucleotide exchange factor GrpE [Gammaproteobacteria bacterium]|jgi:molecular chaperone GrpE|nr:nucleotide exchange factor GrpE [Gammaproteobacteria bacterium]HAE73072.1 nucleotide exchange factor GrpE [Gammaproteobacteria bacterium]HAO38023.1 nucleotide exchange factor GrpE [Gammaproteobacteria bacterium]HAO45165.1 nucleotide exchange factor GrpE [Gammaproteobacteria bacterium]HAO53299.1 nucleotide exchange factor GrpE [Gammaproteobacteria bacterium]
MTKKKAQEKIEEKGEDKNVEQVTTDEQSDDLQTQLEEAQQSAKDNWDKALRAQAEMENLKRRNAKDLENAHKFALDGFVKALLEVKDSLTMGLKTANEEKATIEHIIEGLEMTDKVFLSTMEKFGVETINPKGEPFNPEFHEAVTMLPMPDQKSNSVLEVVQIGFSLNGRLVRPAMVVVVQ